MSFQAIGNFFPCFFHYAASRNHVLLRLLQFLFPNSSPAIPSIHLKAFGREIVHVKWPLVAIVSSMTGTLCFIAGKQSFSHPKKGSFLMANALLWYCLMCLGGFFHHSFFNKRNIFYCFDVFGTCCSSVSLIAAILGVDDRISSNRRNFIVFYAMATIFVIFGPQWAREALYLLPTTVALCVGSWYLAVVIEALRLDDDRRKKREKVGDGEKNTKEMKREEKLIDDLKKWVLIMGFGGVISVVGLVFNRWIMGFMGPHAGVLLWFFVGCGIALLGSSRVFHILNNADFALFCFDVLD
ncbi:uncharacterized protein LOC110006771 [Amborella trichopoda]|uniref:Uncharacterized protein n=1 Tax=Amborella trichopoda TaxID=13333 RepID=W1NT63_AMBTC|nr:uncharacterized protein LOC110006771 [Amborella trichopoda]ERN00507.1 hypothetical protein AMTR_s00102p00031770 [Amborella trichopoda]|eukprot:XP_020519509.1 uncharacterized protein LOC110006771 [Amborella trichopoda]